MTLSLVSLLPEETRGVLRDGGAAPLLDRADDRLASAIAAGASVSDAARTLGIPLRTVQRRLARLRDLFGVSATRELAVLLAKHGYGELAPETPPDAAGKGRPDGEASPDGGDELTP